VTQAGQACIWGYGSLARTAPPRRALKGQRQQAGARTCTGCVGCTGCGGSRCGGRPATVAVWQSVLNQRSTGKGACHVTMRAVLPGTKGEGRCKVECSIMNVSVRVFWGGLIGCMHVCTCGSTRCACVWLRHRAHATPRSPGVARVCCWRQKTHGSLALCLGLHCASMRRNNHSDLCIWASGLVYRVRLPAYT